MLKHYFFLLAFSLFSWSLAAQCPSGDVTIVTQAQLDDFVATYPNCTTISGTFKIGNGFGTTDISDLSGLSNLTTVTGDVSIFFNDNLNSLSGLGSLTTVNGSLFLFRNNALSSLSGLDGLSTLGGELFLFRNENLTSVAGLTALSAIGTSLSVRQNGALTDLSGFSNISSMNGFLSIRDNTTLTSLVGLENIATTGIQGLNITNNPQLSNCAIDNVCSYLAVTSSNASILGNATGCAERVEVVASCLPPLDCPVGDVTLLTQSEVNAFLIEYPNCTTISGTLRVGDGDATTNISSLAGLTNITTVTGDLSIFFNDNLSSLGDLNSLASVGGGLYVFRNNALTSLSGLGGLSSIGGEVFLFRNDNLTSLSGMSGLSAIGGNLVVRLNPALPNLDGLESLLLINGGLTIRENASLTDLEGIRNLDPAGITILSITNNPQLNLCAVESVCTYLEVDTNFAAISGNAPGCANRVEVKDICTRCPDGDVTLLTQAEVDAFVLEYPNCSTIDGNLRVGLGDSSTDIDDLSGLNSLKTVTGLLAFFYNDELSSLTGLEALNTVGEGVYIFRNNALTSLEGLGSLTTIDGKLHIFRNDNLTSLNGLNALTTVGGELRIRVNDALLNLSGLDMLSSVGSFLAIQTNGAMTSLDGIENLTAVNSFIAIRDNISLTSIDGMANISFSSINNLYITQNSSLSACAIDNVCNYLSVASNLAEIAKNGSQCEVRADVEEACATTSILVVTETDQAETTEEIYTTKAESNRLAAEPKLYPNPTSGLLQIRNVDVQGVSVFTPQGQRVTQYGQVGSELDMSSLPAGIYYLQILTTSGSYTKRVVKVN